MNDREAQRMSKARRMLLALDPFYGWPSMMLQMREKAVGTLCTDGTHLDYDPTYTAQHTNAELVFDIAHETSHCMYLHPWRINGRDLKLANVSGDIVINAILEHGKIGSMATGLLREPEFDGMSMEQVYAIKWERMHKQEQPPEPDLPQPSDDPDSDQTQPGGDPGNDDADEDSDSDDNDEQSGDEPGDDADEQDEQDGDEPGNQPGNDPADDEQDADDDLTDGGTRSYFVPAPAPKSPEDEADDDESAEAVPGQDASGDEPLTAEDWKRIAEQAVMIARRRGDLPGGADLAVDEARRGTVDWAEALRQFVENVVPSGESWSNPDRRFIDQGIYLAGTYRENTPALTIAVDTSGSTRQLLPRFAAEINSIVNETRPQRIDVIYCDAAIARVDTFEPEDEIVFDPAGGGGTSFTPVFEYLAEQDEQPACLIYLTDLEGDNPPAPDYPVLWVAPESTSYEPPFGDLVRMPVGVRN